MLHTQTEQELKDFKSQIWLYYRNNRRSFPWRDKISPYRVFISEIMLQQTQTQRVLEKFDSFVEIFGDFKSLAEAPFYDILKLWKGLGYNRRALALQKSAQCIVERFGGLLPMEPEVLQGLPGIGKATAGSIAAFAFNSPTVFLETNIRTVLIHFFFKDRRDVHDKELLPLMQKTVDQAHAREWYYALMDYGVMLKKSVGNLTQKSAHYTKQTKFEGSDRQIRGLILQALLDYPELPKRNLYALIDREENRIQRVLNELCAEGLVEEYKETLRLRSQ
jgi:A/G-specific adenine glycosylase